MISVVIPYYHEEKWKECIEGVRKITLPYKLIVSDCRGNGLSSSFDQYIIHKDLGKTGYTKSINSGIKMATGDKVLLLNADAVMTEGTVEELDRILSLDERIGMVGARAFSNGAYVGPVEYDIYGKIYGAIKDFGDYQQVRLLNSKCVLIRREMIDDIGVMDEAHFWHDGSDIEYSIRAVKTGWKLMFAKNTTIYHDHGRYKRDKDMVENAKNMIFGLLVDPNMLIAVEKL